MHIASVYEGDVMRCSFASITGFLLSLFLLSIPAQATNGYGYAYQKPVAILAPDVTATVGQPVIIDGSASIAPSGERLRYFWQLLSRPEGSNAQLWGRYSPRTKLVPDVDGDYRIRFFARGAQNDIVDLIVSTENAIPHADAGTSRQVSIDDRVILEGWRSSDFDGDDLLYSWNLDSAPDNSTAALDDPSSPDASFIVDTAGDYVFSLKVSDDGLRWSEASEVTISTDAVRPTPGTYAPRSMKRYGPRVFFDAGLSRGSDPASVTWNLLRGSSGYTYGAFGRFSGLGWVRATRYPGDAVIQLKLTNEAGSSYAAVLATTENAPPVAKAKVTSINSDNDTAALDGAGSWDTNGDAISYQWSILHSPDGANASFDDATSARPLVTFDTDGLYIAQLIVNDGSLYSHPQTVRIEAASPAPFAEAGEPMTLTPGGIATLDGSNSYDLSDGELNFDWELVTVTGTTAASLILDNPKASVATITFSEEHADYNHYTSSRFCKPGSQYSSYCRGHAVYELTVTSGNGRVSTDTVVVSFNGSRAVARAGDDITASAGDLISLDASGSADTDGTSITAYWSVLSIPEGSQANLSDSASLTPSFTADIDGLYIFQLLVKGPLLLSEPDTVVVSVGTVAPTNTAPVAALADANLTVQVDEVVQFDGSSSFDPDGDALAFAWSEISKPANSESDLDNTTSPTPTFTPDSKGEYRFSLTVSDGELSSTPVALTLTVPNRSPEAQISQIGNGPFDVGEEAQFDASGSTDPDQDSLSYSWTVTSAPDGAEPVLEASESTASLIGDLPGSYTLQVAATDGDGGTSTQTVTIEVVQPNLPPEIATIEDQDKLLGESLSVIATATDPDGDPIAYSIQPTPLPVGATFDQATGVLRWRPESSTTQTFTISASDGLNTATETFVVSFAQDIPDAPTRFSGRVLDASAFAAGNEIPLAGAVVTMNGVSATSDANGEFSFADLGDVSGTSVAAVDPGTLVGYGGTDGVVDLISGAANVAETPFLLPTFTNGTPLAPTSATTVSNNNASVSVTIAPGSATNADGSQYSGPVALATLPPGTAGDPTTTGFEACELVSLLPKGVTFSTPAQVSLPNVDNLEPGTKVELWAFDSSSGDYQVVGEGLVSDDGSEIATTAGGLSTATTFTVVPVHLDVSEAEDQTAEFMIPSLLGEGNAKAMVTPPSWTTFGDDRGAPMLYNSTAAAPNPIISINATIPEVTGVPERFIARLEVGGRLAAETIHTKPSNDNGSLSESVDEIIRQAAQFDATDYKTGRYDYRFILTAEYGCSKTISVQRGEVLVRNQSESPYGAGWSIAGLPAITLVNGGGALLDDGDGSLKMFDRQADGDDFRPTPINIDARWPGVPYGPFDLDQDGVTDLALDERFASRTRFFNLTDDDEFDEVNVIEIGTAIPEPDSTDEISVFPDIYTSVPADMNNDGVDDLVYATRASNGIFVALADGTGNFQVTEIAGIRALVVAVGDFNADGILDVAGGSNTLRFYLGNDDGEFTEVGSTFSTPSHLATADLDGDGDDEVVAFRRFGRFYVYDFSSGQIVRSSPSPASGVTNSNFVTQNMYLSDVTNDGNIDIIAVGKERFSILSGDGQRGFNTPTVYQLPAGFTSETTSASAFEDADGDGDLDLYLAARPATSAFYIARNDGSGDFSSIEEVPFSLAGARGITFRELNGDGSADLIVTTATSARIFLSDAGESSTFLQVANDFTTLVEKDDGGFLRTFTDGAYQDFSATGLLTSMADAMNRVTSFTYDGEGRLLTRTDPGGTVTNYTYGPDGRLASINDPASRQTNFEYDAAGRMIEVTYPDASTQTFTYDADGRIVSDTDRLGDVATYSYGPTGRLASATAADGRTTSLDIARDIGLDRFGGSLGGASDPLAFVAPEDRVTTMRDERGLPYRSVVNEFGSLVSVEDFSGRLLSYIRDDQDRVIEYTESEGLPAYFLEDGQEETNFIPRPTQPSFLRGLNELFGVTTAHAQASCENRQVGRGARTAKVEYQDGTDYRKRFVEATDTLLERTSFSRYDVFEFRAENGETFTVFRNTLNTDAVGNETRYEYDSNANLSKVIDALGQEATYVHTRQGLLTSYTDFAGRVTTFAYDVAGNLSTATNANGVLTRVLRDALGRPTLLIEAEGSDVERRTSYQYDENNRVASITDAVGSIYGFNFDSHGNLQRETLPDTLETIHNFNDRDWPTTMSTPDRGNSVTEYPRVVRQFKSRDPQFRDVKIEHYKSVFTDSEGREFSTEWKPRIGEAFDFYPCENLVQQRLWIAGSSIETVDALGHKRTEVYDGADRLIAVIDARGNTTTYGYDILDRIIRRTNPNGDTWTYEYDALDRRTATVDAKGQRITFQYDPLNRLVSQTAPDDAYSFSYDAVDNLTAANDNDTNASMTYDVLDRLTSISVGGSAQASMSLSYTYDALDRRATVSDAFGGTQSYQYDGEDRLTQIESNATGRFTLNYDAVGRHTLTQAPNNVLMNSAYEPPTGRLDTMSYLVNSAAVEQFDYAYDEGGDFALIEDISSQKTYLFDNLERLVGITTNAAQTETYAYDPEGNYTASPDSSTYLTDPANRLIEDDNFTYAYDANGNLTSRTAKSDNAVTEYTYDSFDRMTRITFADEGTASYSYDIFGRRVRKEVTSGSGDSMVTFYTYDGPDILLETAQNGLTLARYTHGQQDDQPLAVERYGQNPTAGAGQSFYYHADHLGTIRAITTEVGAIAEARDFDAFGKPLAAAVVDQPYGFTGREYDAESGLYFYRARHYDPATGRFLQEDPLGFDAGDLNLYRYTWNDPLHWTDPSGLTAAIESGGLAQFGEANGQAVGNGVAEGINCILNGVAGALAAANAGGSVQGVDLGKCAAQAAAGAALGAVGGRGGGSRGNRGGSGPQKSRGGGGGGGGCSFDGSTLVLTEEGYKPIRDLIAYEDRVWSRDENTDHQGWKTVEGRFSSYHDAVVILTIRDIETGAEQVIRTTKTHPFYVASKRLPSLHLAVETSRHGDLSDRWIGAADLAPGDQLVNANRSFAEVVSIRTELLENFKAYNLSVADYSTFFVLSNVDADPIWVHNTRGQWRITKTGTSRSLRSKEFGKVHKHASSGLWWSKDNAGHGRSTWKVFQEFGDRLEWIADADEFGDFIDGKHKGPTGKTIPKSKLNACKF